MTSTSVSITVTVHIPLPHDNHTNTWYRALAIPVHRLSHFSNSPLRWLCYLGFALTASKGKLCESGRPESDPVNYDLPVPLDSSTDYYFHPEQDVRPIDPDLEANSDSSTNESARDDIRERLISRDGTCVVNGAVAVSCEGAHLIRFSRGNEYIEHLTTFRSCEDDDPVISNINDIRNGLLVNSTLHKVLCKSVAFLQTPNFILSPRHVDPENTSNALCIYPHDFQDKIVYDDFTRSAIRHGQTLRLPQSLDSWPSHTIFATIYGAVALNTWPVQTFVDEIRKHWKNRFGRHNRDGGVRVARQQQRPERARMQEQEQDEEAVDMMDIIMMLRELMSTQQDEQQRQSRAQEHATRRSQDKVEEWLRDSAAAG